MRPCCAVLCGAAFTLVTAAAPANAPSPTPPDRLVGFVTGFDAFTNKEKTGDVLVFVGEVQPLRCGRVLRDTSNSAARQETQLVAKQANLQIALHLAEASCAQVEVNYITDPKSSKKVLTRVHVMDR
jgi:hypothetical protein